MTKLLELERLTMKLAFLVPLLVSTLTLTAAVEESVKRVEVTANVLMFGRPRDSAASNAARSVRLKAALGDGPTLIALQAADESRDSSAERYCRTAPSGVYCLARKLLARNPATTRTASNA